MILHVFLIVTSLHCYFVTEGVGVRSKELRVKHCLGRNPLLFVSISPENGVFWAKSMIFCIDFARNVWRLRQNVLSLHPHNDRL